MRSYLLHGVATFILLATPWGPSRLTIAAPDTQANTRPAGGTAGAAIDGILSRSSAIYNLKLAYKYSDLAADADNQQALRHQEFLLTVQGNDWVIRYPDSQNFRMNRNRASVTYYEITSKKHGTDRAMHLEDNIDLQTLIGKNASHAAPRLGTFWFPEQARFLEQHRGDAVERPTQIVDGVPTRVFELPVSLSQVSDAMVVIPMAIAKAGGGYLRIYAAESIGWALARIEYVGKDGRVYRTFSASGFKELDDGIFFPTKASSVDHADKDYGQIEFNVHKVSHVNQLIPDDEFELQIPIGTRVRDSRPGMAQATFALQEPAQVKSINAALGDGSASVRRVSTRMALLIANVSLVLFVVLYRGYIQCRDA